MAAQSKATANKRARERARQEWQKEKAARREENRARKTTTPRGEGEDPDIAGIVPGPQSNPWGDELELDTDVEEVKVED